MAHVSHRAVDASPVWEFSGPPSLLRCFPDYLIIGPQRTGTTWLADNLRLHPDVFVSNPKELFFFNLLDAPLPRVVPADGQAEDLGRSSFQSRDLAWYLDHFTEADPGPVRSRLRSWAAWLADVAPSRPMIGEATASYAADVSTDVLRSLKQTNPRLRAIVILRNPVQRAWSHLKKDLLNASLLNGELRSLEDVGRAEIDAFIDAPYQLACGHPSEYLGRWAEALGEENVHTAFFDDIRDAPGALLRDACRFLGVEADAAVFEKKDEVVEKTDRGERRGMDAYVRDRLEALHGAELDWLRATYDRPFQH